MKKSIDFRRAALAVLAWICLSASGACSRDAARGITFRTQTMGTWASLTVVASDSAAVAATAYRSLRTLHRVDSLMSNWTTTSEVARINRSAYGQEVTVNPEVAGVIGFALNVSDECGGAFDITVEPLVRLWGFLGGTPHVPDAGAIDSAMGGVGYGNVRFDAGKGTIRFDTEATRIDLGGIAKGYGVDRVAEVLRSERVGDALVDLSGNMFAMGDGPGHKGWTVGIRDPAGVYPYLARIHMFDEAVATSGDYEQFVDDAGTRHGHILDPRTGWSARGLSSVTVVTAQAVTADAWATALFVLGPEKARALARSREDLKVVLVEPGDDDTATIWVEEQLRERFELREELRGKIAVRYF